MDNKEKNEPEKQSQEVKKANNAKKFNVKIDSLDMDKMEYQQIVLSQSNYHDRDFFR